MEKTTKTDHAELLQGLYAITPASTVANSDTDSKSRIRLLTDQVAAAIEGGARVIQYREKSGSFSQRLDQACILLQVCHSAGVPLLINDDVELAQQSGADGVHLGSEDTRCSEARQRLGPDAIIGISCYNQLALAVRAQQQGADYVAFGRFFPSRSKPRAVQADPQILRQAGSRTDLPVVAIGGITPENGRSLVQAGASMLAVIDAVFGGDATDLTAVRSAAQQFSHCFTDV